MCEGGVAIGYKIPCWFWNGEAAYSGTDIHPVHLYAALLGERKRFRSSL